MRSRSRWRMKMPGTSSSYGTAKSKWWMHLRGNGERSGLKHILKKGCAYLQV